MMRMRGMALVAVLWVVLLGALLLLGAQREAHVQYAAAHNELAKVQARWLARAGIEQATAVLQDDYRDSDSSSDLWYDDSYTFDGQELAAGHSFTVYAPLDDPPQAGVIRFGVIDLASRININTADEKQIAALPILDEVQVQSIIDWRDADERPRPAGAEQGHYDKLDLPYNIANAPFQTVAEYRLVRGIDDAAFFGEDTNLNGRLDGNENDGDKTWPDDNGDGTLSLGIAHLLTPYTYELNKTGAGDDRVNVNKANESDLKNNLKFSQPLAKGVISKRGRGGFNSLMDLLQVQPEGGATPRGSDDDDTVNAITLDWLARNLDSLTLKEEEVLHGRININTASREVLMTLPEIDQQAADAIISARQSEQGPFVRVGDLHAAKLLREDQFKAVAEKITVRGDSFEITSMGSTPSGVTCKITAVIDRGVSPVRLAYWYEHE